MTEDLLTAAGSAEEAHCVHTPNAVGKLQATRALGDVRGYVQPEQWRREAPVKCLSDTPNLRKPCIGRRLALWMPRGLTGFGTQPNITAKCKPRPWG